MPLGPMIRRYLAALLAIALVLAVAPAGAALKGTELGVPGRAGLHIFTVAPEDYGALCNNSHDDTTALATAITASQSSLYPLQLSSCTYKITSTLNITGPIEVAGISRNLSQINYAAASGDAIDIGFNCPSIVSNVTLRDFVVTTTQTNASGYAVNGQCVGQSYIQELYVFGQNDLGNGIGFTESNSIEITGTYVQNVTGTCFSGSGVGASFTGSTSGSSTTLTASSVTGTIAAGEQIYIPNNLSPTTTIVSQLTGTPGGAGTYQMSTAQNITSQAMITATEMNGLKLSYSHCTGSNIALTLGDYAEGIYASNNIFYNETMYCVEQTAGTNAQTSNSYNFTANDCDSTPDGYYFTNVTDAHIVGNRFGFQHDSTVPGAAIFFLNGAEITIASNNIIGLSAVYGIGFGDGGGTNKVKQAAITGNTIVGGHFCIDATTGSFDIAITGNYCAGYTSNAFALANNGTGTVVGNAVASSGSGVISSSAQGKGYNVGFNQLWGLPLYTVSSGTGNPALPSTSAVAVGTIYAVTDATSCTSGSSVTGGGSTFCVVVLNNTPAWVALGG